MIRSRSLRPNLAQGDNDDPVRGQPLCSNLPWATTTIPLRCYL